MSTKYSRRRSKVVYTPPRKTAFEQDDTAEMSFSEIAEEMGMTRQGVIRIYNRAMRKLQAYFNRYPEKRAMLQDLLIHEPWQLRRYRPYIKFAHVWDWDLRFYPLPPKPWRRWSA